MSFGIAVGITKDEGDKHSLVWIAFRDNAGVAVSPDTARMVAAQLLLAADLLEKSNEGFEIKSQATVCNINVDDGLYKLTALRIGK